MKQEYKQKLLWVMRARSKNANRPILQGMHIVFYALKMRCACSDGYRVHRVDIPETVTELVGSEFVIDVSKLLPVLEKKTAVITGIEKPDDNSIVFHIRMGHKPKDVTCSIISGRFPDYELVFPRNDVQIRVSILESMLNDMSHHLSLKFDLDEKKRVISIPGKWFDLSADAGTTIAVSNSKNYSFSASPEYLSDACFGGEFQRFDMHGPLTPIVGIYDDPGMTSLVMPMS